jgi:hypothetical protein
MIDVEVPDASQLPLRSGLVKTISSVQIQITPSAVTATSNVPRPPRRANCTESEPSAADIAVWERGQQLHSSAPMVVAWPHGPPPGGGSRRLSVTDVSTSGTGVSN